MGVAQVQGDQPQADPDVGVIFGAMVPFHAIAGTVDTKAGNIVFNWAIPLGLVYWGIKRSTAPEESDAAPVQPVV